MLLAALSCAAPAGRQDEPRPGQAEHAMTPPPGGDTLAAAFARAVDARGGEYASVRAAILRHPDAPQYLRARVAAATSWRERLTAEMLIGWIEHKAQCDEAFAWLKDEQRRRTRTAIGKAKPGEIAASIAAIGPAIAPWAIEAWLKTAEHEDGWEEAVLVQTLALLKDPRSFEPVLEVFENKAEVAERRISAAYILKSLADARALPALERALRDEGESDALRNAAAGALAELTPSSARMPLEDVLGAANTSPQLKSDIAFALAELRDPASRPALERALEQSSDTAVIAGVAFALGRVGNAATIELLRATVKRKIDSDARQSCEDAIREIELQEKLQ
jgi:HEAT repeat protein